jgi:hypothetical protein
MTRNIYFRFEVDPLKNKEVTVNKRAMMALKSLTCI